MFPDFTAVKYFQREFELLNEFHHIEYTKTTGFDIYLVQQWVTNRHIGLLISTYTGNTTTDISVIKFTTVKKPSKYYPLRFQEYLNELVMNHAKLKQLNAAPPPDDSPDPLDSKTDASIDEYLFITNITSLPSHLGLIPIPGGDIRQVDSDFVVNSNLRKLHCSGRSISLITPKISDANEDKFRQMYRIFNLNVPIKFAVRELVNIIQTCLFYFDLLDARYCDGLLCNKTEEAINNWWNLIGLPHYNSKPNHGNGVLPARTVAAIISLIISIKLRLQMFGGCDVPKDPFDFENFMISIGEFQRQVKLDKRRKLDVETLAKLFYITNTKLNYDNSARNFDVIDDNSPAPVTPSKKNKNYAKEIRKLTTVVKNTVHDRISTVNRPEIDSYSYLDPPNKTPNRFRERLAKLGESTSPDEVETLNLDVLVNNYLVGKTLKRLWYGVNEKYDPDHSAAGKDRIRSSGHGISRPSSPPTSPRIRRPGSPKTSFNHAHNHVHDSKKLYKFVSLRDNIANTQRMYFESSKYPRGLNRMKLGIQRNLLLNQPKKYYNNAGPPQRSLSQRFDPSMSNALSTVDALLKIPSDTSNPINNVHIPKSPSSQNFNVKERPNDIIAKLNKQLNRRNSFPMIPNLGENNLNILELAREGDITLKTPELKRSKSVSVLNQLSSNITLDTMSRDYLNDIALLIEVDNLKRAIKTDTLEINNVLLEKKYQSLNQDIQQLKVNHKQLENNKAKMLNEQFPHIIEMNIDNLSTNIDRLFYESRIILKRLHELEQNAKVMKTKLQDQGQEMLNGTVHNLIHLNRFHKAYDDPEERKEIILKLTGGDEEVFNQIEQERAEVQSGGIFRILAMFIWEMLVFTFQLFKFDRSRMNLDRIRDTWGKLDPNRKYINKAYNFVGHDSRSKSLSGSISSKGSSSDGQSRSSIEL